MLSMLVNHFAIQQLVFDISFYEQNEAYQLQSRISKLYNNYLNQQINDFFDSCIPSNKTLRLPTLQLDLGTLSYNRLEEEITKRLLQALREQFSVYINQKVNSHYPSHNSIVTSVPLQISLLQSLESFFSLGILPWHVGQDTTLQLLEEYLNSKIKSDPAFMHDWIMQLGQSSSVRKRIAWQLLSQTVQNIIKLIAPNEAPFIISYHASINELQQKTPIVNSDSRAFRKDVWNFILTFLIKESASNFSRKEFLKSNLKQLAAHYNVGYHELLFFFNKAATSFFNEPLKGLVKFVQEIAIDEGVVVTDLILTKKKSLLSEESNLHSSFLIARYFIMHGSLPPWAAHIQQEELTAILIKYISAEPKTIGKILSKLQAKVIAHRLSLIKHNQFKDGIIVLIALDKRAKVITELSITELQLHSRPIQNENDQSVKELIQSNQETERIDILHVMEIFLTSGILPWWLTPGFSFALLEDMFRKMVIDKPATVRNWLIQLNRQAGVLKRIVWQLNKKTIQYIFEVLEPEESLFIHSYSVYIIQLKQQISIAEQDSKYFQQNIWYYMLTSLTADIGTSFNKKNFVKNSLLKLSAHYSLDYLTLLQLLTTVHPSLEFKSENGSLLQIFNTLFIEETNAFAHRQNLSVHTKTSTIDNEVTNLVKDTVYTGIQREEPSKVQYSESNPVKENEEALVENKSIENLLIYFITTGNYPWWATAYYSITPSDLLAKLYALNAVSTIKVFQFASTDLQKTERFLNQFPVALLLKIIGVFPDGQKAIKAYLEVLDLYNPVNIKPDSGWLSKEKLLIKLIWQQYLTSDYSGFNEFEFYIEAIKQFCHYGHLSMDEVIVPIISLLQTYDEQRLKSFFKLLQLHYVHQNDVTITQSLPDELVTAWLTHMSTEIQSKRKLVKSISLLTEKKIYVHTIEYFFKYKTLPSLTIQFQNLSSDSIFKTILLRLQQIDTPALLSLLEKHYYQPGVPQRLHNLFTTHTHEESTILLALNKLHFKNVIANLDTITDTTTSSSEDKMIIEPLLIQQYHLTTDGANMATILQVAKESLDYFLTWEVLPQAYIDNKHLTPLPVEYILKEIFFILFNHDRNILYNLLQQKTHLPSARIKLHSIFARSTDNQDLNAAKFLSVYTHLDLLEHFHTTTVTPAKSKSTYSEQPVLLILEQYVMQHFEIEPNNEKTTQEGFKILDHYLSYNKLPKLINNLVSDSQAFVKSLFRYLRSEDFNQLKDMVSRVTNRPEAKLKFYEWGNYNVSDNSNEVNLFTPVMLQQDVIVYLKSKLNPDLFGKDDISLSFLQTLSNQSPERVTWLLDRLTESSAGIKFLCTNYSTENMLVLLKMANQTWTNQHLELIKGLQLLFERILLQTNLLPKINQLLQEFILLIFSEKGKNCNTLLFISRFFAFLDSHTTQLSSDFYKQLQSFRQHTNNISLFNNHNTLLHLQKEISFRMLCSSQRDNYIQLAGRIPTDTIEIDFTSSNQNTDTKSIIAKMTDDETMLAPQVVDHLREDNLQLLDDDIINKPTQIVKTTKMASDQTKKGIANFSQKVELLKSPTFISSKEKEIKVYVQNAGLILLHPFISTLFGHTGLLEGKKFVSDQSTFKAIHLLQYIVDGRTEHEEQHLPLNKIICGLLLEEPVPKEVELSQDEIAICEGMLTMIFQRWDKMKNTTIDGFRQAFLQRAGMITYANENWVLRVEQKGHDVLLTTLPWSYGMIKLPWMKKTIYVEWT